MSAWRHVDARITVGPGDFSNAVFDQFSTHGSQCEVFCQFIEFSLINTVDYDWRANLKEFPSDSTIIVENGSAPSVTYSVHLRILSMLSDVCYRISSRPMDAIVSYFTDFDECASCDGDLTVKLLDGSTFTIGSLVQLVSILKEKMEELQGIPACDQRMSQQYDPSAKTLTLLLPDVCARFTVAIVLRIAH